MNVLAFLAANWDSVLVVVAFLAVVVVLIIDTPSVESLLVGIEEQAVQTEPAEN